MTAYATHNECILCGSSRLSDMPKYSSQYLTRCDDCRFVFSRRIPTVEELIAHYETYGRDDYLSPITVRRFHEILDFLEPYRRSNKLIDVGCGIGHFLEVAAKRGWDVYGTEFTDTAIDICRSKGIRMEKGVLDPSNYPDGDFDVVTSFEVIEHINNPNEELANFNSILRQGGAVYVTTPNFNSISRMYLGPQWNVIEYPEHLSYYTAVSLSRVMRAHGFKKKWIKTSGISVSRFQASLSRGSSAGQPAPAAEPDAHKEVVGRDTPDEKLRRSLENNPLLRAAKFTINSLLNASRKGDSMKGLFEKSR